MHTDESNRRIVLYVGHAEFPDKDALSFRIMANCRALKEAGFVPVLLGSDRDLDTAFSFKKSLDGFDLFTSKYPESRRMWFVDYFSYHKYVAKIADTYGEKNVFAIIYGGIGAYNICRLNCHFKKKHIRLVSDSIDWFGEFDGSLLYRAFKKLDEVLTYRMIKPRLKNHICISNFLKSYFDKKGCNTICIPSLTFSADRRFSELEPYATNDLLRIVYAGNPGIRGSKDRIDWCVQAFHENMEKKAILEIFGMSKEEFTSQFPRCSDCARDRRIIFRGLVPNDKCLQAIRSADFITFAREDKLITKAGFPTKLSESFALGTPVITTPSGDVSKYIINGETGFVSENCCYKSFKAAMDEGIRCSKENIMLMHRRIEEQNPLDYLAWMGSLKGYFESLADCAYKS